MPKVKPNPSTKTTPDQKSGIDVKKLTELEEKSAQLQDKLTRSLADYINLEKRIERDREFIVNLATTSILSELIEVLDNLELAQNHLKDQGLQMALDHFVAVLKNHGLTELNPQGQEFNPETMEAVGVVDGEVNKVVSVGKKGYLLNNQVVRPAKVMVGKKTI